MWTGTDLKPGLAIIWMAGWLWWTLSEYVVNRWLYHLPQKSSSIIPEPILRHHKLHHQYPDRLQYNILHPILLLLLVSIAIAPAILFGVRPFLLGFSSGFVSYTLLHICEHRVTSPSILFKGLWQNHFLHHNYYPDAGFGVSTQLWDYVFNTVPERHVFFNIQPTVSIDAYVKPSVRGVRNKLTEQLFLDLPEAIYCNDPNYVPAIVKEISDVFNPLVNPFFQHGDACRWIVVGPSGEVVGRIAAFVNYKKMGEGNNVVGGIGFFECINDKTVALLLFDTAEKWLKENFNVTTVDGPINFGENDKFCGLLIKGFSPPSYGMNYNPWYYQEFFESNGYAVKYKQLTNQINLCEPLPPRFEKIALRVLSNSCYSFKAFEYDKRDQFIKDFIFIYNNAWASFNNFQPIAEDTVRMTLAEIKLIVEEKFIWFAYAEEKPVGFVFVVPDVNEILRYSGGNLNWLGKLKFMFWNIRKGFSRLRVVAMGIVPEYQNRGLESALIYNAYCEARKRSCYKEVELSWVGDFNHKMIAIHKALNSKQIKQHATFRKQVG
jgi:GNAT superfamily N-acetyltransferase